MKYVLFAASVRMPKALFRDLFRMPNGTLET
jgi:hypothetical protein